ncbi:MAG TPA: CpsD/CapB family tyrosine-protein kinase [Acidobacteriaceae bacterium]
MSQIFDALRRSESERPGDDSSALPQGTDLLRRAERRAAERWEADGSRSDLDLAESSLEEEIEVIEVAPSPAPAKPAPRPAEALSKAGRAEILEKFPSLQISLAPQSRLVCLTDKESPTAEAIRLLGVRLRDIRRKRPLKKVLITSTIPQEGKSTISANLACALALTADEKVLLVEGDLRRPSLMRMFGIERTAGMSECIRAEGQQLSGIYHLEDAGLWILPAGKSPGNPLELLQSHKLRSVMDQLTACFDWIIIDTPPVLPLADTSIWTRMVDGVLLVTRQGTTQKHELQKGLEALDQKKLLGALLNGAVASVYSGYYENSSLSS